MEVIEIWIGLWARANERNNGLGSATYYGVYIAFGGFALLSLIFGGL